MICGKCKDDHETSDQVRQCYGLAPSDPELARAHKTVYAVHAIQRSANPKIAITEGMWKLGDRIIKMQIAHHGSGRLYGKELIVSNDPHESGLNRVPEHRWERLVGAERMLRERGGQRMTLEEAQEFGRLYGFCCVCGAILTDETSIENGIGPVCGKREKW